MRRKCKVKDVKPGEVFLVTGLASQGEFIKLYQTGEFNAVNSVAWVNAYVNDEDECEVIGRASWAKM